jgi:hypothetical protein
MSDQPGPLDKNDAEYTLSKDWAYALILQYEVFESKLRGRIVKNISTFYLLLIAVGTAIGAVFVSLYAVPMRLRAVPMMLSNIVSSPIPSLLVILFYLAVSAIQAHNELGAIRTQAHIVLRELYDALHRDERFMKENLYGQFTQDLPKPQ